MIYLVAVSALVVGIVIGGAVGFGVGLRVLVPTFLYIRAVARARARMIEQSAVCKKNPGVGKTYDGLDWAVAILDEETYGASERSSRMGVRKS